MMSSKSKTTATKEQGQNALVPKLRFPEFRKETLRDVRIGDVTEECRSRNGHKHTVASVMGVTKADGIVPMEARLIAADIARYKLVQNDWFAYNPMRLNIGSIAQWKGESEILVSPDYVVFKCLPEGESGINPAYLDQFRGTNAWEEFVTEGGDGGVRVRIYYKDIARIRLALPSPPEQQKIAECLSSADELIAAQARKLDALKTHKKGLMQQLFPREGEAQPRLRFPEFKGDWVLLRGAEITSKITKGSSPNWQGFNYQAEGVLFITSENVRDGFLDVSEPKFLPEEFFSKQSNSHLLYGDILINIVGSSIGRSCVYRMRDPAFTNQAVALFRVTRDHSFEFLSYCYQHDRSQKAVSASQSDSARPNLSLSDLREMEFCIPPLPEQRRIADCLTSLDELIAAQSQKLAALKTHKQGLMQQLFPTPEAMA